MARIPLNLAQAHHMPAWPVFQANTPPPSEQVTWQLARIVALESIYPLQVAAKSQTVLHATRVLFRQKSEQIQRPRASHLPRNL